MVTSPVGCPRFFMSQAVSSGICPGTCVVSSRSVSSDLDNLTPIALVVGGTDTSSRHWSPASPFSVPHSSEPGPGSVEVPDKGLQPYGPQVVNFEMADRRDWGGGGDDPEERTQRMIDRIWESLTNIQRRMDQQAPVPPVAVPPGDGETVPIDPVPPPPGMEVPFVAPLPPPPPVLLAEEPSVDEV
ncbi:hypothetical protein Taro_049403 [Colocasia esculenta]|uniref:Uncharacterized protein n=1 Tax=Colocasia esculenta TaxID=4460 RepID=A0A843XB00_COLES|nr:hypothetical protein [Colocasia esculenta]